MSIQSPNYTQYPNEILDKWMSILSGPEFKVISCICRKTFGWSKSKDKISLSQIIEMTGLSRQGALNAISKLEKHDIIICNHGQGKTNEYCIKIDTPVYPVDHTSLPSRPVPVYPVDTQKKLKETSQNIINTLSQKWNNLSHLRHHKPTTAERRIKKKHIDEINDCGIEVVFQAFENYNTICSGNGQYWWTHRTWTMWDFIVRGLDKFVPDANPLKTFKKDGDTKPAPKSVDDQIKEAFYR